jgi:hypothetical protein
VSGSLPAGAAGGGKKALLGEVQGFLLAQGLVRGRNNLGGGAGVWEQGFAAVICLPWHHSACDFMQRVGRLLSCINTLLSVARSITCLKLTFS